MILKTQCLLDRHILLLLWDSRVHLRTLKKADKCKQVVLFKPCKHGGKYSSLPIHLKQCIAFNNASLSKSQCEFVHVHDSF